MRKLSDHFMHALKEGILKSFPELVRDDHTLCLEIRKNYINIYYRGGNLTRISQKNGIFEAFFDRNYLSIQTDHRLTDIPHILCTERDTEKWIKQMPHLKHAMDIWFGNNPKEEREYQQRILRENNLGKIAIGTDYYVCDIEYADRGRFDMICVHWTSTRSERKKSEKRRLAFIELKYGDGSLKGRSGIKAHINKAQQFVEDPESIANLKSEMLGVFNQKHELGLINCKHTLKNFSDEKPEFIFIFANHDPESTILKSEIDDLPSCPSIDLKFAASNFMGGGLYNQQIYDLEGFKKRFRNSI